MITRIEIDGFKSLRNVAVDLEPLTAIVGPNGSGKSNVVEALQVLSRLAEHPSLERALQAGRGTVEEQFSRVPTNAAWSIRWAVDLLLDPDSAGGVRRCRYSLEIGGPRPQALRVVNESLRPIASEDDAWLSRHPGFVTDRPGKACPTIDFLVRPFMVPDWRMQDDRATLAHQDPRYPPLVSMPSGATDRHLGEPHEYGDVVAAVVASLRGIALLHCDPKSLRESSDPSVRPGLREDGANLPTTFDALNRVARAAVLAGVADLVPGLSDIEVQRGADGLLGLRFSYDGDEYPARLASDGTLRALALLMLAQTTTGRSMAVVEEPENGIHPAALRRLLDKLRAMTQVEAGVPPQFILVSHSPALVAALEDQPESLVFAELTHSGDGARYTRMLHVRREGEAADQGRTNVSPRHIQRILDTAASAAHVRD